MNRQTNQLRRVSMPMPSYISRRTFLLLFFFSSYYLSSSQTLEKPKATGEILCGAGAALLSATSIYDDQEGLQYNWYQEIAGSIEFVISEENGLFVTPEQIITKTYYVSISLNGQESLTTPVTVQVINRGSVLESAVIQLCDTVVLHGSASFNPVEMADATYQWQRYVAQTDDIGYYLNISDSTARLDSIIITVPGFYRVIVTRADGCRAISAGVEVTEEVVIDPSINGGGVYCFLDSDLPSGAILTNTTGRSFSRYSWEISTGGAPFTEVSTDDSVYIANPGPADTITYLVRLTMSEQRCSETSPIDTIIFARRPDIEVTHMGSTDNFFYCDTEPASDRTLKATSSDSIIGWERIQYEQPLSILRNFTEFDPFHLTPYESILEESFHFVASGDSLVLTDKDWGIYRAISLDTMTGCINYSNFIFAETAIPDIAGSGLICLGSKVVLAAYDQTSDTYSWTFQNADTPETEISTDSYIELFPPFTTGEGDYQLTVTKNGCTETSALFHVIEVDTPPKPSLSQQDTAFCSGGEVAIGHDLEGSGLLYSWTYSDGIEETLIATTETITVDSTGYYRLAVSNTSCFNYSDRVLINVFDLPDPTLNITSPTCGPVTLNLDSALTAVETYEWHFSSEGTEFNSIADSISAHLTVDSTGYYYASIENNNGCRDTSNTVEILGIVIADIEVFESEARICGKSSFAYLEVPSYLSNSYLWYYSADGSSFNPASGINTEHSYKASLEGYYKVAINDGICSGMADSVYVQIETVKNTSFNSEVIGSDIFCSLSDFYLYNDYPSETAQYTWSFTQGTEEYILNVNNDTLFLTEDFLSTLLVDDSATLAFSVEVYDSLCSSISDPHEVVLYNTPALSIINSITGDASDVLVCEEADVTLSVTGVSDLNQHFQWQKLNDSGVFEDLNLQNNSDYTSSEPGSFRCVSQLDDSACPMESNTIRVRFLPSQVFAATTAYCNGDTVELMADAGSQSLSDISDFEYVWYSSKQGNTFRVVENENGPYLALDASLPAYGDVFYFYEVSFDGCTRTSDTLEITREYIQNYDLEVKGVTCLGIDDGSIAVTINDIDFDVSYTLDDTVAQETPYFEGLSAGIHYMLFTTPYGCTTEREISVPGNEEVVVTLSANQEQYREVSFTVTADGAETYEWFPHDYLLSASSSSAIFLIPQQHQADSAWITVEGTDARGCIGTATIGIHLNIIEEVTFPKVISPDGDGNNDDFDIIGLPDGVRVNLTVFDNWGNNIYSSGNYQHNSQESENLNHTLFDLKEGVYYYVFKSADLSIKGSFYIKK